MSDIFSEAADLLTPPPTLSRWFCNVPKCDGEPHEGWHWCEHSLPHPPGEEFWRCRHARANQRPPKGNWRIWLILAGRGFGKLLALDTPIPTPTGWTPIGQIQVGDEVFDEAGRICQVTKTFDELPERAWRIKFSDGSEIIAGGEHQWVTWTHADRKAYLRSEYEDPSCMPFNWPQWRSKSRRGGKRKALLPTSWKKSLGPQIRTTDEIVQTLFQGNRGDRNHSIPLARPLELPYATLLIDPYVLGYWLGDGSSSEATVTIGDVDAEESLERLAQRGSLVSGPVRRKEGAKCASYPIGGRTPLRDAKTGRMLANGSMCSLLQELGVLKNKHIPAKYLRGSGDQRLELLQGLMDSDGHITKTGKAEFTTTRVVLASGVAELARSLGEKPHISEGRATLNGRDCGPKWRVTWAPASVSPVLLSRKAARLRKPGAQHFRNLHRMVVAIEPTLVRPMRCLTVDSQNHMFLAGEGMIPTHNTRSGAEWIADGAKRNPMTNWAAVAPTREDLKMTAFEGDSGILQALEMDRMDDRYNKSDMIIRLSNGSTIRGLSAERPEKTRGPNLAGAWLDEIGVWRYPDTYVNLSPALRRGDAKVVATTTPRPTKMIMEWAKRDDGTVIVTKGSMWDNAPNLSPDSLAELRVRWEGTRLGRQELEGELLEDVPGALWSRQVIEETRAEIEGLPSFADLVA